VRPTSLTVTSNIFSIKGSVLACTQPSGAFSWFIELGHDWQRSLVFEAHFQDSCSSLGSLDSRRTLSPCICRRNWPSARHIDTSACLTWMKRQYWKRKYQKVYSTAKVDGHNETHHHVPASDRQILYCSSGDVWKLWFDCDSSCVNTRV
jgi:hypothetical protein